MSPEFALSYALKIQLIIRTERFYIIFCNKEMHGLLSPVLQFFHNPFQKLPGNSLVLKFLVYSHPGDFR